MLNGYQQVTMWCAQGAKGSCVFVQRIVNGSLGLSPTPDPPKTRPRHWGVKLGEKGISPPGVGCLCHQEVVDQC